METLVSRYSDWEQSSVSGCILDPQDGFNHDEVVLCVCLIHLQLFSMWILGQFRNVLSI